MPIPYLIGNPAGGSDRAVIPADAVWNDLDPISYVAVLNVHGFVQNNRLCRTGAGGQHRDISMLSSGTPSGWQFNIPRATVGAFANNPTGTIPGNVWRWWFFTYDGTDGPRIRVAPLNGTVTEPSYTTRTVGSGAPPVDVQDLWIMNREHASPSSGLHADWAFFAMINTRLTLAQCQRMVTTWRPPSSSYAPIVLYPGLNGGSATVESATPFSVPLTATCTGLGLGSGGISRGLFRNVGRASGLRFVAPPTPGGSVPVIVHGYRKRRTA